MALGEKLFEENRQRTGLQSYKSVHPVEETTMEVSFISEIKALASFQVVEILDLVL